MKNAARTTLAAAGIVAVVAAALARPADLALRRVVLSLPGPPAVIVPADLNGDGRKDLLVIVAYTRWGSIATDRIENAVQVTQVVPALFDIREARAFLAEAGGGYREAGGVLKLPTSVLSAEAGPPSHPVVAVTDDGLSEIRLHGEKGSEQLTLEPLLDEPSVFAGTGTILADLSVLRDVDGDGKLDAVIPAADGIAVHRGTAEGFAPVASLRARLPGDVTYAWAGKPTRSVSIPEVEDADGDGKKDLVVRGLDQRPPWIAIARGMGEGRFAAAKKIELSCLATAKPERRPAWAGDLYGDGRIEVVTREEIDTGKSDMKQMKQPLMRYEVHRVAPDLSIDTTPATTFEANGWAFSGAFQDGVDLQFIDLDGDRRKDLVTITLDFSMFQALRAITAKKVSIGLEFHVIAQQSDGSFKLVPDQKLDEALHLDLNHLEISRLGEFQGDFDGDGRTDFVHLGRGKSVTIHRGEAGGHYPTKPDLELTLDEEPEDVMLIRVRDFDGDGRSDIAITRTSVAKEGGATAPVALELNLSGGAR